MPTTKQRINVTVNQDMGWTIKTLAKRDKMPMSAKVAELLEDALELEEDLALAAIADARSKKKVKYIPFEQAWKGMK